jgi:tetratricopeptide (TPR) repeat protein
LDNKTHQQHAILKDAINSKDLTQRLVDKLTNKILDLILMCELEAPTSLPLLDSEPLSTRLFKVSKDFGRFETTHEWARKRIRQKLRDNPNDSKLRILMAVILNNRQIMGHVQRLEEVENQILELVQSSVDDVSGDALYLSACAGLLYRFGNKQTAKQKLENSLALGTHIAACYLEAGRINAFEGNFEAAHWYYDHAIIDAHEGSDFHQMLLTLKAIAYLAEGNSAEVSKALAKMLSHEENFFKRVMMEFLFNSRSRDMRLVHRALYKSLPGALFKRVLLTAYNNSARWFEKPEHQYNLMARMTDTTIRLKGRSCIPAEVLAITDMDSQVSERQSANST